MQDIGVTTDYVKLRFRQLLRDALLLLARNTQKIDTLLLSKFVFRCCNVF